MPSISSATEFGSDGTQPRSTPSSFSAVKIGLAVMTLSPRDVEVREVERITEVQADQTEQAQQGHFALGVGDPEQVQDRNQETGHRPRTVFSTG